jgi:hypothetical protein
VLHDAEEVTMDRGENQNSRATPTFSKLNWPTQDFVLAAKRARGKALRDMLLALVEWTKARGTAIADVTHAAAKR